MAEDDADLSSPMPSIPPWAMQREKAVTGQAGGSGMSHFAIICKRHGLLVCAVCVSEALHCMGSMQQDLAGHV